MSNDYAYIEKEKSSFLYLDFLEVLQLRRSYGRAAIAPTFSKHIANFCTFSVDFLYIALTGPLTLLEIVS